MIIRKPYALLIKNFKLIHFFILIVSSYILYKTSNILNFFDDYVDTRQFIESDTLINDIIPFSVMIFAIFLIFACSLILILFRKKDKPIIFYLSSVIYYVIFIIVCLISREIISTIMFNGIDPRIARIVRDVWLIEIVLQVPVIVFSLIRTLGFDIKKFNFVEDLHELRIDLEDNEEVEVTTNFDSDKIKMRVAMQKEELRAFFAENRFVIIIILFLLVIVIPSTFIAKNKIENKRYSMGEIIKLNGMNLKITGAYLTKKNNKGQTLLKGNNSYLIISFNINNHEEKERGITLNNLRLEVNNKVYMPKTSFYEYFTDIGVGYVSQKILKESRDYIAVYAISDDDIQHEMVIRFADKLTIKNSEISALYYRTIIEPVNIDVDDDLVNKSIKEDLIIDYKELKGIKFSVSHYNLKDKFIYNAEGKSKYIINSVGLVLSLNYEYISDSISFDDFVSSYMTIRYKYNNYVYTQKINNITPKNYKSNEVYFAVSENLKDATTIELIVRVRNAEYVYKIK